MQLPFEIKMYAFAFCSYLLGGFAIVMIARFALQKFWVISLRSCVYCAVGSAIAGVVAAYVLFQFDEGVRSGGSGMGAVFFAVAVYAAGGCLGFICLLISFVARGSTISKRKPHQV